MPSVNLGIQEEGQSSSAIVRMAIDAAQLFYLDKDTAVIADIGGGRGDFSKNICTRVKQVKLLDYSPSQVDIQNIESIPCNLNGSWPLESASLDGLFSLEVIEHLENPRHFFREVNRVLKPGAYGFVSTPNNHNIFSRILFLFVGCHRFFKIPVILHILLPYLKKILKGS